MSRFKRIALFILSGFLLFGCGPVGDETAEIVSPVTRTPAIRTVDETLVRFTIEDLELTMNRPDGWELYSTEYGVVLAEFISSVATEGTLDGLLMHVFVPPLDDFDLRATDGTNLAWRILSQIIENPEYVGSATVSEPVAFQWGNSQAAYYLMDNGEGNVTIVVGIVPPGTTRLIAGSVSAPFDQAHRIREQLPWLLDQLTINNLQLNGAALDFLPDPLVFPRHESRSENQYPV